jgi:hypothetical protein
MTAAFIPDAGALFYVRSSQVHERIVGGGLFGDAPTATVVKSMDNSYRGDIFECTGRDASAVVGVRVSSPGKDRRLFMLDMWSFAPVGPEVASAMRLDGRGEE